MDAILRWTAKSLESNANAVKGIGSFGFLVPKEDLGRYFVNDDSPIHLHLLNGSSHQLLSLNPSASFWCTTRELIDIAIRAWIGDAIGFGKWYDRTRPKVLVWPLEKNCFAVLGVEAKGGT
jgi:hypothetical protein